MTRTGAEPERSTSRHLQEHSGNSASASKDGTSLLGNGSAGESGVGWLNWGSSGTIYLGGGGSVDGVDRWHWVSSALPWNGGSGDCDGAGLSISGAVWDGGAFTGGAGQRRGVWGGGALDACAVALVAGRRLDDDGAGAGAGENWVVRCGAGLDAAGGALDHAASSACEGSRVRCGGACAARRRTGRGSARGGGTPAARPVVTVLSNSSRGGGRNEEESGRETHLD